MEQKVDDHFGDCVLNQRIALEKSKSLEPKIKKSCDVMEGGSSFYATTLPGLVIIGIVTVKVE